ncbi:hypothetical protein M413DRAFT_449019 [Hebeloma cylindrosporum]|uniref:Uncharacterized protein n=1 Tax=Hebeloma cylindrosporum TaxID=76867 RepID=A0A0C3BZ08_HEBCY|nr:hypothetical protein M413DRAFT_449019 [Hebeloma cylindrosporum h7]
MGPISSVPPPCNPTSVNHGTNLIRQLTALHGDRLSIHPVENKDNEANTLQG